MKRKSNNNSIQIGNLDYEEELEENGIYESPITGTPVAQFTFENNSVSSNKVIPKETHSEIMEASVQSSIADKQSELTDKIKDNKLLRSQPYGITPPVNGEYFDTRRSFSFRKSTIRMLNELKATHPNINVYLNSIVDKAICHYYEYIFKEKGSQE